MSEDSARPASDQSPDPSYDKLRETMLSRYFDTAGRLSVMPAKQSRQRIVLDLIAGRFVPGVRYAEPEINRELMAIYDDYVSLRRALVDHGFLDRADGRYWRSGGTVEI